MQNAFNPALVRGVDFSTSKLAHTGSQLVPQSHGDPNYYATKPAFDPIGFWHAAGTNPPIGPPKGDPVTPADGEWVKQGTATRNKQSTSVWVWYPPKDKAAVLGVHKVGSLNYLVKRGKIDSGTQVFLFPEYWAHKFVVSVPAPPASSYKPQSLEYDTVDGIVPVVGTFNCKKWLLVYSYGDSKPNAIIPGGMFGYVDVINYYVKYVGLSPYFTYRDYLFKFEYDTKTKKYIIRICTDGLNVQKNPPGDASNYTVYSRSGGSGGELKVQGMGSWPRENSMEAFSTGSSIRGLGRVESSVFNVALVQGLGRSPEGLGQFLTGGATLTALSPASVPPVDDRDWIQFYPNDSSFNYQGNTDIGYQLIGLINQIRFEAPGYSTVYWLFKDPSANAALTVSTLGNGVALLRSSYEGTALKLEIARKTVPVRPDQIQHWPAGAVLGGKVNGSNSCGDGSTPNWVEVAGLGGNVAAAVGINVALPDANRADILNNYLLYLQQPQFLRGVPADGKTWQAFGVPVPIPQSVPDVHFSFGGQLYKVSWVGTWVPGQVGGGGVDSGPVIYICANPPVKTKIAPPIIKGPAPLPGPAGGGGGLFQTGGAHAPTGPLPPWLQPVQLPSGAMTPGQVAQAQAAQAAAAQQAALSSTPVPVSTGALILGGILVVGILGGAAYLILE